MKESRVLFLPVRTGQKHKTSKVQCGFNKAGVRNKWGRDKEVLLSQAHRRQPNEKLLQL